MNPDEIIVKIDQGGSVRIEVGDISPANRTSLESFADSLASGLGEDWTIGRLAKDPQTPDDQEQRPRLDFFRRLPPGADSHPPLISSLQSLETCFCLIALEHYPHALIACAAAIESALKAKLAVPQQSRIDFPELIDQIGSQHPNLGFQVNNGLKRFREARNAFTHFGFSPRDDDASVDLLLQTGLPYLKKCYRELFALYLDCRELPPAGRKFEDLSEAEMQSVGLNQELADQMRVALEVHRKLVEFNRKPSRYCINTFAQYLNYQLKSFHRPEDAEHPDSFYGSFSCKIPEASMREAAQSMWQLPLEACLKFDCSICGGFQTLLAEGDEGGFRAGVVRLRRAMCVRCGLSIPADRLFLADTFLQTQIAEKKDEILCAFSAKGLK